MTVIAIVTMTLVGLQVAAIGLVVDELRAIRKLLEKQEARSARQAVESLFRR